MSETINTILDTVQARDWVFALGLVVDVSLLYIAARWVFAGMFGWRARLLLLYAALSLNMDYALAIIKLDRILRWDGFWHRITLPTTVNFVIDLLSRFALLSAIWLLIFHLLNTRNNASR